jgi:hypothetical protein
MRCPVLGAALVLIAVLATTPAAGDERVDPGRPDATDSPSTVPPGAVQVEAGLACGRKRVAGRRTERELALEAALRIGITPTIEVQLEGEPIVHLRRGRDGDTGPGDLTLIVRWRFLDAPERGPGLALGVQPFVKLPLAEEPIGSERLDAGVIGTTLAGAGPEYVVRTGLGVRLGR